MRQQQRKLLEPETKQAKCNGNTINNIGHEETNKQTKELLMPGKLKESSSFREDVYNNTIKRW